ncbi:MAG: sigma-70 family RNA polymerase sigma factor [Chloroflexi bacterium]|nr:sigma-70 family RNA polymerase sigma factor [Chloroflexota bacterium]
MQDEQELVRRAQAGNTDAFAALVAEHQRFVYNLALRTVGDANDAEDIAQEAFVRAWRALGNFRRQAEFRTWPYRIVINLCYTRLPRLRQEMNKLSEDEIADVPDETFRDPQSKLEIKERDKFLHQQIETLPATYRMLISLRFQEELSYEEISQLLNLPLGTVKTGIFRARALLRQALTSYDKDQ